MNLEESLTPTSPRFPYLQNYIHEIKKLAFLFAPGFTENGFRVEFVKKIKEKEAEDKLVSFNGKRLEILAQKLNYIDNLGKKRSFREREQNSTGKLDNNEVPVVVNCEGELYIVSGMKEVENALNSLKSSKKIKKIPILTITIERKDVEKKETKETFEERLRGKFSEDETRQIIKAYDLAKEAHSQQHRDRGELYFEHPINGCLIMMDTLGLYDKELLISFLLHDVGEDTKVLGDIEKSWDDFVMEAKEKIKKMFGEQIAGKNIVDAEKIANIVIALTRPKTDGKRFFEKAEIKEFDFKKLTNNPDAILLKMIDRLHNLRTLFVSVSGPERIRKQISSTKADYMPIFENLAKGEDQRAIYARKILKKIREQIKKLEKQLSSITPTSNF